MSYYNLLVITKISVLLGFTKNSATVFFLEVWLLFQVCQHCKTPTAQGRKWELVCRRDKGSLVLLSELNVKRIWEPLFQDLEIQKSLLWGALATLSLTTHFNSHDISSCPSVSVGLCTPKPQSITHATHFRPLVPINNFKTPVLTFRCLNLLHVFHKHSLIL